VNFFQRFQANRTDKNQTPPTESSSLPKEEKTEATDRIKSVPVDDPQYVSLVRALRPKIERALRDLQLDVAKANFPAVVGGANKPPASPGPASPDQSPGPPIV
jgi:hypothetical protein